REDDACDDEEDREQDGEGCDALGGGVEMARLEGLFELGVRRALGFDGEDAAADIAPVLVEGEMPGDQLVLECVVFVGLDTEVLAPLVAVGEVLDLLLELILVEIRGTHPVHPKTPSYKRFLD